MHSPSSENLFNIRSVSKNNKMSKDLSFSVFVDSNTRTKNSSEQQSKNVGKNTEKKIKSGSSPIPIPGTKKRSTDGFKDHSVKSSTKSSEESTEDGSDEQSDCSEDTDFEEMIKEREKINNMITAQTPPDPFITIQPRSRLLWVEDNNAPTCGICTKQFNMLRRRHHCRICGGVFCGTCSDHWSNIPDSITQVPTITGIKLDVDRHTQVRMCDQCYDKVTLVKKLEVLLKSVQETNMDIFAFKNIVEPKKSSERDKAVESVNISDPAGQDSARDLTNSFIQKVQTIPDMTGMEQANIIDYAKNFMNGKL